MTNRTDAHQDQAFSARPPGASGSRANPGPAASEPSRSSPPSGQPPRDRRRPGNSLGIGAPLTAAFIGGFLVIENLAGAEQAEGEGGAVSPSNDPLLLDPAGEQGTDQTAGPGGRAGADGALGEGAVNPADPAASPSEDPGLHVDASGGAINAAMPAIAAAAVGVAMPEGGEGGGLDANLSILNINLAEDELAAGAEPFVEDEVLQRKTQFGTPGDDILFGTPGDDAISGGSGDDIIHGGDGRDLLNGNEGDDQLFGGAGNDNLKGGAGNDFLDGGEDYDLLLGGSGDDVLLVNNVHDVALDYDHPANSGIDTLVVRQGYADELSTTGIDSATFLFSEHLDLRTALPGDVATKTQQVAGGIENVRLEGTANHDIFADARDNELTGNGGDNVIYGDEGDDLISGRAGNDQLHGGGGDDEIFGGSGDDVLEGGLGEDMLYGDGGDDLFLIGLNDSAIDTVFDHSGANRIKLEGITDQTVEASLLGDDLYVTVDQTPVARIQDYAGHEDAFEGVDFGQGLRSFDSILTERQDLEAAVEDAEIRAAEAAGDDLLAAHLHLTEPTIAGEPRTDQRLDGTEGDDWLSGFDGKDILFGKEGNDILEGGDGSDDLRGGAGDDRYLFSKGESGIDKITDTEGRNLAEIKGYSRADIDGAMLGDDLAVLAGGKVLFTVNDFAANEGSFHGVQVGNRFVATEDLLA